MTRHRGRALLALALLVSMPAAAKTDATPPLTGQLLYSRLTDGTWQIWQTDLATQARSQVTFSPGDKRYPSWVADGSVTYCMSHQACFQSRLGDAQKVDPLLFDLWPVRDAVWSPHGRALAFSRFRTDLVDSANLWIAEGNDTSQRRMITHEVGIQEHPAWSPDGEWIAYSGGHGYGTYELYVVRADGSQRRQLTQNHAHDFLPAWSPDGRRIAFSSDVSEGYEIWTVDADGSNLQQVTRSAGLDTSPAWSPDGQWIAFATNRSGKLELWVMRPDGSEPRILANAGAEACDPAWR